MFLESVAQKHIERLYEDTCTIYRSESVKVDGRTKKVWTAVCEDEPCRLSFQSLQYNTKADADTVSQTVKLFIASSVSVPAGCRIEVKRMTGDVLTYERSGEPAIYPTHQEILLSPMEDRA